MQIPLLYKGEYHVEVIFIWLHILSGYMMTGEIMETNYSKADNFGTQSDSQRCMPGIQNEEGSASGNLGECTGNTT